MDIPNTSVRDSSATTVYGRRVVPFPSAVPALPETLSLRDFRAVVEAVCLPILLVGQQQRILLANSAARLLLGYGDGDSLQGVRIAKILPRSGASGIAKCMDDSQIPVEVSFRPLHVDGSDVSLVTLRDLVAMRRMERDAAHQRDELARLSRVTMLGELAGALAHELNQPLGAILSNAQAAQRMLRHGMPLSEIDEIMADIVEDDRRAGEIIQRLRRWLRRDAMEREPVSINDAIVGAIHMIRCDLLHRNVEVLLDLGPDLPLVSGDRVQLQQVIINLVFNGCEAMETTPGPHVVTVQTHASSEGGVQVDVTDRGCGISPMVLRNMFAPFESTKPNGLGMGLAICRTIIEGHDGRIHAEDFHAEGARLTFVLPAIAP